MPDSCKQFLFRCVCNKYNLRHGPNYNVIEHPGRHPCFECHVTIPGTNFEGHGHADRKIYARTEAAKDLIRLLIRSNVINELPPEVADEVYGGGSVDVSQAMHFTPHTPERSPPSSSTYESGSSQSMQRNSTDSGSENSLMSQSLLSFQEDSNHGTRSSSQRTNQQNQGGNSSVNRRIRAPENQVDNIGSRYVPPASSQSRPQSSVDSVGGSSARSFSPMDTTSSTAPNPLPSQMTLKQRVQILENKVAQILENKMVQMEARIAHIEHYMALASHRQ